MGILKASRTVLLYLFILLVSVFYSIDHADAYSFYSGEPTGKIAETQPLIYQQLLVDINALPTAYEMRIDNEIVPVTYNPTKMMFIYQPEEKLAPGTYQVSLSYVFKGFQKNTQTWSFEVVANPVEPYAFLKQSELEKFQQEVLRIANGYREKLELLPFTAQYQLQKAAQAHANYSQDQDVMSHDQLNLASPLFVGQDVGIRTNYYGYPSWRVGEGISFDKLDPKHSVQALIDAPYHRFPFVNPFYQELGYGFVDGRISGNRSYHVYNFGGTILSPQGTMVMYPFPNQKQVQPTWYVAESPDPLRLFSVTAGEERQTGYPITLSFTISDVQTIEVSDAKVLDKQGRKVASYLLTPQNDEHLKQEMILIPKAPLQFNEVYTVQAKGNQIKKSGDKEPFDLKWSFTTSPYELLEVELLPLDNGFRLRPITSAGLYAHGESFAVYNSTGQRIQNRFTYENSKDQVYEIESTFEHSSGIKESYREKIILRITADGKLRAHLVDQDYPDVAITHPNFESIRLLSKLGVYQGNGEGLFEPDRTMTRAEFATTLVRLAKILKYAPIKEAVSFDDVRESAWYSTYVREVSQLGWIEGYHDQTFRPQATFDRVMLATILVRMAGLDEEARAFNGGIAGIVDQNKVPKWARGYVYYALELELLDISERRFEPSEWVSRAYVADAFQRLLLHLES